MSPNLQEKLKEFGWKPGRRLDDAELHTWLRKAIEIYDCHIFPEAVRIVQEFGGLMLWDIHIDPRFQNGMYDEPALWWSWEWEIEKVLFPIGADTYITAFAVASDGKIYSEGIAGPHFCADSFEEFLEIMAQGALHKQQVEMIEIYEKRKSGKSDEIYQEAEKIYKSIKR